MLELIGTILEFLIDVFMPLVIFIVFCILIFMFVLPAGAFGLGVIYYAKEIIVSCFNMAGEIIETIANIL